MTVTTTGSVATTTARLSAGEAAAYLALVQAQAAARKQLTQAAVDAVFAALTGFGAGGWWDAAQITKLTQQILKQVQPAQKRAARLTDSYVARMVSKTRGKTVRPVGAVDVTQLRRKLPQNIIEDLAHDRLDVPWLEIGDTEDGPNRDIDAEMPSLLGDKDEPEYRDPADVYGRLADKYRWEVVTQGASHEEALEKVKVRAEAAVDTDIALAVREQETWTARKLGVQFYRRVLHPELAESGLSCGLCIVASDRIYSVAKFKRELHDHCHCEMIPVENGKDPGLTLNEDDLESLYRAAGKAVGRERETSGAAKQLGALKRVRVGITEHGELGPILVKIGTTSGGQVLAKDADEARVGKSRGRRGGDPPGGFRTIKDYAKTQTQDPAIRAAAQLVTLERTLAVLEEKVAGGMKKEERSLGERKVTVDLESALKWQREQVARLRKIANG